MNYRTNSLRLRLSILFFACLSFCNAQKLTPYANYLKDFISSDTLFFCPTNEPLVDSLILVAIEQLPNKHIEVIEYADLRKRYHKDRPNYLLRSFEYQDYGIDSKIPIYKQDFVLIIEPLFRPTKSLPRGRNYPIYYRPE